MAREDPEFARHIDAALPTLGDVIEAGDAIRSLFEHPAYRWVKTLVEEEVETLDRQLDRGRPLAHEEYASLHGRRGGLRGFQHAAETILARSEKRTQEQAEREAAGESAAER